MQEPKPAVDRTSALIAILIAVISVVAAVGAWRVALASSAADDADTEGLLAAVDREDSVTGAYITSYGRYAAYARAVGYSALADLLKPIEDSTTDATLKAQLAHERDNLIYGANQLRFALPQRYLDRDQLYDLDRDIGEQVADRALERDTFPDPHFDRALAARAQSEWLLGLLVLIGLAFVLLTLADAIKNPIRYALIIVAVLLLLFTLASGAYIELVGPPFVS